MVGARAWPLLRCPLPAWAPRPPSCSGAWFSAWEARGVEATPGVMPVTVTGPSWVWDGAGPGAGSTGCSEQPQAAAGQPGISFVLNPFPFLPGDPGSLRGGSEGLRATAGSPTTALHSRKWLCVRRRGRACPRPARGLNPKPPPSGRTCCRAVVCRQTDRCRRARPLRKVGPWSGRAETVVRAVRLPLPPQVPTGSGTTGMSG